MKIPRHAVSADAWRALEEGLAVHVRTREARYWISGRGALPCLQGLVTCDLARAGDGTRLFGALLTAKGMIVTPLWIERRSAESFVLEAPATAAAALEEIFTRSLPPRLCRYISLTETTTGLGFYGPRADALQTALPSALPAVVRGMPGLEGHVPTADVPDFLSAAEAAGAFRAGDALVEACRIFAGIPALGAEIDDRTLPQEVRFEELGAVSYTKGCYLGQETVARVHFRGHPNRQLALLVLDGEPDDAPLIVMHEGKDVGRLTSTAWSDELDVWVGQAVLRREVEDGGTVALGLTSAVVRLGRWLRAP